MEERIIKDEYGRGIRMKKTEDGYVDATDELVEETEEASDGVAAEEEVVFEFPQIDEDDEELAALMPEEAEALKKKREEERKKKQAEYEEHMQKGNLFLSEKNYAKAEEEFSFATNLALDRTESALGFWKAKTEEFAYPDRLPEAYEEYGQEGEEEFFYDLGEEGVNRLKEEYGSIFQKRLTELREEKAPLEKRVRDLQASRREILAERKKKHFVFFLSTLLPSVILLLLGILFLARVNTRPDRLYLYLSVGFFVAFLPVFFVFVAAANKLINTCRIIRENEDLSSTEDGARLAEILYKEDFYAKLV